MEKLTPNEEEAMQAVWNLGSGTIKEFLEIIPDVKPPYTTLASTVKNLERKKFISATKVGNTFSYTPLIKEEEYKKTFMGEFVNDYFSNSYKELVTFFANQEKISADDLKEIIKMIEKGKQP
ncbi:MAG: BlaI/MecI/CopY family transcriptional regulator [Bacteroidota bacterium]